MNKNFLIVDHSATARKQISAEIEDFGFHIIETNSGKGAIETCKTTDINIMSINIELPDLNGFKVISEIRRFGQDDETNSSRQCFIICITSSDTLENRLKGFEAGASLFIEKSNLGAVKEEVANIIHPPPKLKKANILLIEDSEVNQILIMHVLKRHGAEITVAGDAEKALSLLSKSESVYDLIISDYNLPGINGVEFCKKVRFTRKFQDIGIILLTGEESKDKIIEIFQAGASDYIRKPFILEELVARVSLQIENHFARMK